MAVTTPELGQTVYNTRGSSLVMGKPRKIVDYYGNDYSTVHIVTILLNPRLFSYDKPDVLPEKPSKLTLYNTLAAKMDDLEVAANAYFKPEEIPLAEEDRTIYHAEGEGMLSVIAHVRKILEDYKPI